MRSDMTEENLTPEQPCRPPATGGFSTLKFWFLRRWIPIFGLLLIILLVVGLFLLYRNNPDVIDGLERYGYIGAFLISIALNATLFLPAGNFLVLAALGATLPSATLVGLAGGLGAAIGESTGYFAGRSGRAIIGNRDLYDRTEGWMHRWGFWALFGLSVAPLFFDLAGIAAGACRYKFWKFFAACWLGRSILYVAIAWGGLKGWEWLLNIIS
jgi:membrane protein DedA with SNARE-associated domain